MPNHILLCIICECLIAVPMLKSVFDAGFNAKVDSCQCGQVQSGSGLIKAFGGGWGVNGSKVQTNSIRSSLNKLPHLPLPRLQRADCLIPASSWFQPFTACQF